jgi:hypothetical protein
VNAQGGLAVPYGIPLGIGERFGGYAVGMTEEMKDTTAVKPWSFIIYAINNFYINAIERDLP